MFNLRDVVWPAAYVPMYHSPLEPDAVLCVEKDNVKKRKPRPGEVNDNQRWLLCP
jgi:hypothetical protein